MSGWIKLHRQLLDNPIFKNHKLLQTFLYCLIKASHQDHDQLIGDTMVSLKSGELATGRKAIAAATGLSEQNVRTSLSRLKTLQMITIKPTTKYSIISIVNWDSYQQINQQTNQVTTNKQPTNNQQVTTNKNVKNYKNDNKYTTKHFKEALISAGAESVYVDTWIAIRKKKKATNSEIAFNSFMKQVGKSKLTVNQCLKIACEESWSGFKAHWLKNIQSQKYETLTAIANDDKFDWR